VASDGNGLASIAPSSGGFSAPLEADVTVSAGTTAMIDDPLFVWPALSDESESSSRNGPAVKHPIALPVGLNQ